MNTASRLEGLNKILGTRVLVSAATLAATSELAARDLGAFLLRGKSTPLRVQELLSAAESARCPAATAFAGRARRVRGGAVGGRAPRFRRAAAGVSGRRADRVLRGAQRELRKRSAAPLDRRRRDRGEVTAEGR